MTILLSSIDPGDRARKDYGDLTGLAESMQRVGQLHSIVLSKNADNTYKLICGGRRVRVMQQLGVKELHHGDEGILTPGRFSFLFKDEIPDDVLKEAELDENLYRLKPRWQEDVMLIADVHALKRQKEGTGNWGIRQTADLLGPGYGRTQVSWAVRVAKALRAGDKDLEACENMSDATSILFKRKEDEALAELQRRGLAAVAASRVGTTSLLDTLNISLDRKVPSFQKTPEDGPIEPSEAVEVPLSSMFQCGDFRDVLAKLPDASFNHVVTDIPYGIDMDNMDTRDMSSVAAEHDVEQNVSMMEPFLAHSFRLVRGGGFCVFFYDLDHHAYLQQLARAVGWKVQRWPLIVHKTSACQNNAASYNFTKNFECAMVLRRDEKTVLRSQQSSSVWMGDFAAERRLYNNPFAKPFALWKWIYDAIAFPGQSVLDPFCGEMSGCRAAANCGLTPFGVELRSEHFNRGLVHMQAVYALLHKSNVKFT